MQQPMKDAPSGTVYVQTNAAPNEVISFRRVADGSLDRISSVAPAERATVRRTSNHRVP
jgi:hypothetical protein